MNKLIYSSGCTGKTVFYHIYNSLDTSLRAWCLQAKQERISVIASLGCFHCFTERILLDDDNWNVFSQISVIAARFKVRESTACRKSFTGLQRIRPAAPDAAINAGIRQRCWNCLVYPFFVLLRGWWWKRLGNSKECKVIVCNDFVFIQRENLHNARLLQLILLTLQKIIGVADAVNGCRKKIARGLIDKILVVLTTTVKFWCVSKTIWGKRNSSRLECLWLWKWWKSPTLF